jgi:hypothetical protein
LKDPDIAIRESEKPARMPASLKKFEEMFNADLGK